MSVTIKEIVRIKQLEWEVNQMPIEDIKYPSKEQQVILDELANLYFNQITKG